MGEVVGMRDCAGGISLRVTMLLALLVGLTLTSVSTASLVSMEGVVERFSVLSEILILNDGTRIHLTEETLVKDQKGEIVPLSCLSTCQRIRVEGETTLVGFLAKKITILSKEVSKK
jgi:hypothetical protein